MDKNNQQDPLVGKLIFGIDLGTSKSCIGYRKDPQSQVTMISNAEDKTIIPSLVAWDRDHQEWIVGWPAKVFGWNHPGDLIYSIKRYIGRWFSDDVVQGDWQALSYRLIDSRSNWPVNSIHIDLGTNAQQQVLQATPQEISAKILAQLRQDAARQLEKPLDEVKYAVITVPTYFGTCQRVATREAGRLAGWEVVDILNEAIAAALAYEKDKLGPEPRSIVVFSLGGGTCEVAVLEASKDDAGYTFNTVAVDGDVHLGGDDIDSALVEWLVEQIKVQTGQLVTDGGSRERLRQEAEWAKIRLSEGAKDNLISTCIDLRDFDLGGGALNIQVELTQQQLARSARKIVESSGKILQNAIEKAGLHWSQVDEIILVGGQTQLPLLQERLRELSGRDLQIDRNPQLVVGMGAAEYAYILSQGQAKREANFVGVVLGWSYGIEVKNSTSTNVFLELVAANTYIPAKGFCDVETVSDNQREIEVKVFQCQPGTRFTNQEGQCTVLGSLRVPITDPGPPGKQFRVELVVRENSTLEVTVTDANKNRTPKVFSPEQICLPMPMPR